MFTIRSATKNHEIEVIVNRAHGQAMSKCHVRINDDTDIQLSSNPLSNTNANANANSNSISYPILESNIIDFNDKQQTNVDVHNDTAASETNNGPKIIDQHLPCDVAKKQPVDCSSSSIVEKIRRGVDIKIVIIVFLGLVIFQAPWSNKGRRY